MCSSDRIAGVTAFDLAYGEFYDRIHSNLDSSNSFGCHRDNGCYVYIFDSQTFLILAEEFLDVESADTSAYERVSLGLFVCLLVCLFISLFVYSVDY